MNPTKTDMIDLAYEILDEKIYPILWDEIPESEFPGAKRLWYRIADPAWKDPCDPEAPRKIQHILDNYNKYYDPCHEDEIPCHLADEIRYLLLELLDVLKELNTPEEVE